MKSSVLAFALAFGCAVLIGTAHAATNITCVDEGYTGEDTASLERFYTAFRPEELRDRSLPPDIFAAVTRRVGECADLHDWPAAALEDATLYRMASILKVALDRHNPLTPPQMRRLEEAISSVDQTRLNRIFGGILDAAMDGTRATPSDGDTAFLGRLFLRAGIPATQANGEYVGALMAARIMAAQTQARFASR